MGAKAGGAAGPLADVHGAEAASPGGVAGSGEGVLGECLEAPLGLGCFGL